MIETRGKGNGIAEKENRQSRFPYISGLFIKEVVAVIFLQFLKGARQVGKAGKSSRLSPGGEISTCAFLKTASFDGIMLSQRGIESTFDSMCAVAHEIMVSC